VAVEAAGGGLALGTGVQVAGHGKGDALGQLAEQESPQVRFAHTPDSWHVPVPRQDHWVRRILIRPRSRSTDFNPSAKLGRIEIRPTRLPRPPPGGMVVRGKAAQPPLY
jgi:hypothetical protein